jgi:hypothetical protein
MELAVAFKEWAVICRALAEGRQSLILRKGGIAEAGGEFRPEHDRFLLCPTFFHEHRTGIKPELLPLLEAAERDRTDGVIRFTHFAEVAQILHLTELEQALALDSQHGWTAEEVTKRFHYRRPGLFAFFVRIFALPVAVDVAERPEYAGCKTWVPLDRPVNATGAFPVLERNAS